MFNKVDRVNDKSSRIVDSPSGRGKVGGNIMTSIDTIMNQDDIVNYPTEFLNLL